MDGVTRWLGLNRTQPGESVAAKPAPKSDSDEPTFKVQTSGGMLQEMGISGTVNWDGRIQTEPNSLLRDELGRGRAGVGNSWGEWEKIRRTDSACASIVNLIVAPLRDADVEVEPGDEGEEYEKHAEFVKDNLLKWQAPLWPNFVEEVIDTLLTFGFNLHEPVLATRPDERVAGGTAVYVSKMAQRLPSSLSSNPWREKNGELESIVQSGRTKDGKYASELMLPAERVLLWTWGRSGNNFQGYSAFRSVWKLAQIREALVKIFAIGSEREALGIPTASVDKDAKIDSAKIQEFQKFLEHVTAHEHAAVVPPPGVSMEWVYSPAANKGHVLDGWERLGKAIHQVFLTQQVTLGVDGTGSRAVGEVHDSTKNDFVSGVKALFEATLNGVEGRPYTGLARKIVELNFGPQDVYPRIKLVLKRRESTAAELARVIPPMMTAGALTWRLEDENQWREKAGLSPVSQEEYDAEQKRKEEAAAQIAGMQPEQGEDDAGGEEDKKRTEEKPPAGNGKAHPPRPNMPPPASKMSARGNPGSPFKRLIFAWERPVAFGAIEQHLDTTKAKFEDEARGLVTAAVAEQLPAIKAAMKDGDPSDVSQLVNPDFLKLAMLVDRFIRDQLSAGWASLASEYARQKDMRRVGMSARPLFLEEEDDKANVIIPPYEPPVPQTPEPMPRVDPGARERVSKLVRSMRERLIRRLRARVIDDIESEAQYLVRTGGDPAEIVANVVNAALETRGLKFDAASVQTTAFNMGRNEFARERAHEVASVHYSALLDSNTCGPCNRMDGKEFEFGSPEHDEAMPPYGECEGGEQCRCLLVIEFKESGFAKREEAPQ
jgi:hypothetical protein